MNTESIKPSGWFYVLALLLAIGGMIGGGVFFVARAMTIIATPIEVQAPGKAEINLTKVGQYMIFLESQNRSLSKDQVEIAPIGELHCTLRRKETGAEIEIVNPTVNANYHGDKKSAFLVFQFEIDEPGMYEISADYPAGKAGPEVTLKIVSNFVSLIVSSALGALAIAAGSVIAALVLAIVVFVMRRNSRPQFAYGGE